MSSYLSGADYYDASPIAAIPNLRQPILLMHGTLDGRIHYHHSEDLFATANEPKMLYLVEGSSHTNNFEYDVDAYEATVFPFLVQYFTNG